MCLFSQDIIVNSTKIAAGWLPNKNQYCSYQNKLVTGSKPVIMFLPFPAKGNLVLKDTTSFNDFLNIIAKKIIDRDHGNFRSGGNKGLTSVGQYQYKTVESKDLISELIQFKQPVYSWIYDVVEKYYDYKWLFCIMKPNSTVETQPLWVEYEPAFTENKLYFPMMDMHGDGKINSQVLRDHVIIIDDPNHTTPLSDIDIDNFPHETKWDGTMIKGLFQNGDLWAEYRPNEEPNWMLTFDYKF